MKSPSVARVLERGSVIIMLYTSPITNLVAVSSTMLLLSEEPLMKRCMSTGGAVLLFKPLPTVVAESTYQSVIKALGLSDKSPKDRIKSLLSVPADELWQKLPPGAPLTPVADGDTVPGIPTFVNVANPDSEPGFAIPGRKWCAGLMIGESQLDVREQR